MQEERRMTGHEDDFAALIASLDPAMAVVTTASDRERAGCLIGFHAQSSIEPPRYVVWLSKANHTFRVGLHARWFAVHFLSEDDIELARRFGTVSGDRVDTFADCSWEPGPDGLPLLADCPRRFVATRVALLDEGGDHVCVVLEPTDVAPGAPFRPLRLSHTDDLQPGHEAEERPEPATERAGQP
jgi:flavin reductase (DIM6/NTAB) family NADH-FMN oxidoreductase RutF